MALFDERLVVTVLRWIARILGLALIAPIFFSAIWAIRHGDLNPFTASLHDNLIEVAIWTTAVGLLVGWKWEGIGGLLTIGATVWLGVLDYRFWSVPGAIAGLSYLVCWWRERRLATGEIEWGATTRVLKRFSIPLVLMAAHATLVALTAISVKLSSDPEAGMIWIIFPDFDYPISLCLNLLPRIFSSDALFPFTILIVGTIQWGIIGLVLQGAVCSLRRTVKWLRR